MPHSCPDPDPYAELDNRADAAELSEEFRKPSRIRMIPRRRLPATRTGLATPRRRIPI